MSAKCLISMVNYENSMGFVTDSGAPQVEGWDSLGNVRLFLTVEGAFGVRFSAGEISSIKNVGELAAAIAQKRAR